MRGLSLPDRSYPWGLRPERARNPHPERVSPVNSARTRIARGIGNPRREHSFCVLRLPCRNRVMDVAREPETMTETERRRELASIFARGLLRSIRHARACNTRAAEKDSEAGDTGLDLSANSPLSVAPRPAG